MVDQNLKNPQKPSGPVKIGKLIIRVDRDLCIGAATCVAVAQKTFVLDNEAKSIILASADEEIEETIVDAARSCPTLAIVIENEKGERVFPQ